MSRNIAFTPGEYYHVYNRGIEKKDIFLSQKDYDRFLSLLFLCNTTESIRLPRNFIYNHKEVFGTQRSKTLVDICSYCVMPNHFHLLVKEKTEKGLSTFMHKLTTAYTMYFNTSNERSGSLFQGTFKAKHANDDNYLKYLISYIHLNPVKLIESGWKETGISDRKRAEQFLDQYGASSYLDFNGIQRSQAAILTKGSLPEYFGTPTSFKENIREWLEYQWEYNRG